MDHFLFKVEILSNEDREWHESFSLVLGPDDPVEAVLGEITMATVTILDQEASGSLILPATPIVRNVKCNMSALIMTHAQNNIKMNSRTNCYTTRIWQLFEGLLVTSTENVSFCLFQQCSECNMFLALQVPGARNQKRLHSKQKHSSPLIHIQ